MESLTNSRFITHPSLVDKSTNHTVVLINPEPADIENVGFFCKTSQKNFDVYLYQDSVNDSRWYESITKLADAVVSENFLKYFTEFDQKG